MSILRVALDIPLFRLFDYRTPAATHENAQFDHAPQPGLRVQVPFGQSVRVGVIVEVSNTTDVPQEQIKDAIRLMPDVALPEEIIALCRFISFYYQAPLGQTLLAALPAGLKRLNPTRRRGRATSAEIQPQAWPEPNDDQNKALASIHVNQGFKPYLLYGVTGSGKTEVYLHLIARALSAGGQSLLLVPEINLTPLIEAQLQARFPDAGVVTLHSEMGEAARETNWLQAASGEARVVLGTRLAVLTPLPRLVLIIIDEEHDLSFKQQDGARYSARDVAVWRAREGKIPIVLGSATPSLESWANARAGRYHRVDLPRRANPQARLPDVRVVDIRRETLQEGFSQVLLAKVETRLERKEQSLIFLNRRGYAPVLTCQACGWVAHCRRCSSTLVVHLTARRLRCHHCGFDGAIQSTCPDCGNQDITPMGRGTQRLEDTLVNRFPYARILRVDRDSVKSRKQWASLLDKIRAEEADILVGTQMLAKGHNFPNLTLVGVVGADSALYAADCRAVERLFAQLMQVAGRAGRADLGGEVLVQTRYPQHPLFSALAKHDYPAFATSLLQERQTAGLPPFSSQAILRAESPKLVDSMAFLEQTTRLSAISEHPSVLVYDPVPMQLTRLADFERGQLLLESPARAALQAFLPDWRAQIERLRLPRRLRWHIEVDPVYY